ncbi:MAG: hypothetical protein HY744_16495 [Deltaproteobacteria bacterium]|nr:hypothetical protein [Deltaproteobacteria bacterium]
MSSASGSHAPDPRFVHAWHTWLAALATDADAVAAAASLYAELPAPARDAWLAALAEDAAQIDVPKAAIYAPLLAVEPDVERRGRIRQAAGIDLAPLASVRRALLGTGAGGLRLAVLVIPLYLDFVRLLVCRFVKDEGFDWVRQDPIVRERDAPAAGCALDGVELFTSSPQAVIDELSLAVLAHRRRGRALPPVLLRCADLFSARPPAQADCA